ncbi:MAG: hypothetical protein RL537_985 [Actinomycetota bacterium]|jgi:hypothetical protein
MGIRLEIVSSFTAQLAQEMKIFVTEIFKIIGNSKVSIEV